MIDPLLTTKEVARILGKSSVTLEGWRVRGNGPPFIRVGGSIRYAESDLAAYIAENRTASTSAPP